MDEQELIEAEADVTKERAKYFTDAEKLKIIYKVIAMTTPRYIKGKYRKWMDIKQVLAEFGIMPARFYHWMNRNPAFKEIYEEGRKGLLEATRTTARALVEAGINGELKLKDNEKVNLAMRLLEKTDDEFKDKKEVELNVSGIDFSLSTQELEMKARELLSKINDSENE